MPFVVTDIAKGDEVLLRICAPIYMVNEMVELQEAYVRRIRLGAAPSTIAAGVVVAIQNPAPGLFLNMPVM
jgi:hypothetical protein